MTIKQRHRQPIFAAALIVFFLLATGLAQARVGELDPGFGKGGRAFAPLKASSNPMASAPDGSILILNEGDVSRLRPDGQLDLSFGVGGRVTLGDSDGLRFRTSDIAVDSQGRVLVFGTTSDPSRSVDPQLMYNPPIEASWATVVRLDRSGQLDPGFGEGRGFVRSDLGLPPTFAPNLPTLRITTGDVDSQDRPVFVVGEAKVYSPCYGHTGIGWFARAIARLTVAGALDTTFDGDGVNLFENLDYPTLELDAVNGLILSGANVSCQTGIKSGITVYRLGADGAPSTGFGAGGVRFYRDTWRFSAVGPSGAMILRKGLPTEGVLRVDPNGEPDQSFGRNGWASVAPPAGAKRTFRPVAVDTQGRVLLAGSFLLPKLGKSSRGNQRRTRSFFVVARLLPSGKPDLGFGKRGSIVTPLGWPSGVVAEEAFLDSQGRLVIAGAARKHERPAGLVLCRYLLGN